MKHNMCWQGCATACYFHTLLTTPCCFQTEGYLFALQLFNKRQLVCKFNQVKVSKKQVHACCVPITLALLVLMFRSCMQQCLTLHCCHASTLLCFLIAILVACHTQEQKAPTTPKVKIFKLLLDTYVYSNALGTFVPLPNMPPRLPAQLCSAAKALQEIEQGKPKLEDPVQLAL